MDKFRQYRFIKKVEKALNTPARNEDLYTTSASAMYLGDCKPRTAGNAANPSAKLRQTQVNQISALLIRQIGLLAKVRAMKQKGGGSSEDVCREVEDVCVEIEVAFEELNAAMLFTDVEKAERRVLRSKSTSEKGSPARVPDDAPEVDLSALEMQITEWQKEQLQRKKKLFRIETTVRDLGVNVHDVRCAQLSSERNASITALNGTLDRGILLLGDVHRKLQGLYSTTAEG